jgi:hypothetical protein
MVQVALCFLPHPPQSHQSASGHPPVISSYPQWGPLSGRNATFEPESAALLVARREVVGARLSARPSPHSVVVLTSVIAGAGGGAATPCAGGGSFIIAPVIGMKNTPMSRREWTFPWSSLV